jgi:hypothetical protein
MGDGGLGDMKLGCYGLAFEAFAHAIHDLTFSCRQLLYSSAYRLSGLFLCKSHL